MILTTDYGGKESASSPGDARDMDLILGSGGFPGEGNGYLLQYFLPGKFPEEPGGLQSTGSQRVGQDWAHTCRVAKVMGVTPVRR